MGYPGVSGKATAFTYDGLSRRVTIASTPLQTTTPLTDFNYAGMFTNADSGLDLTQYRAYDPVAGRWLSRDPLGEVSDPVGNLYPYVDGDPLAHVDPSGLSISNVDGDPLTHRDPSDLSIPAQDIMAARPAGASACGVSPLPHSPTTGPSDDYRQIAGNEGTPGSNTAQNAQVRAVVTILGLTRDQQQALHREISGQNYSFQEILQTAKDMFGK